MFLKIFAAALAAQAAYTLLTLPSQLVQNISRRRD